MNNQLTADDLIDAEDVAEQSGADVNQVQEAARKNVIEDRASAKRKPCGGAASPVPLTRPTRKPLVAKPQKTTADELHAETDRIEADERTKQIMQKVGEIDTQESYKSALQELDALGCRFVDALTFKKNPPPPFDWIIKDMIAKGWKVTTTAKPKTKKTFNALQRAKCISKGANWVGHVVPKPRRVVYFNLEVTERGMWERMEGSDAALGEAAEEGYFTLVNLRGKDPASIMRDHTDAIIAVLKHLKAEYVVIDPRFKLLVPGEDENSSAGLKAILDLRDAIIDQTGAAVEYVQHDPKGDSAGKAASDRGAGSYIGAADYDFGIFLDRHEDDDCIVQSFDARERKTPAKETLRFDEQTTTFSLDEDTPPTEKKILKHGGVVVTKETKAGRARIQEERFRLAVQKFITGNGIMSKSKFDTELSKIPDCAIPATDYNRLIKVLVADNVIACCSEKSGRRKPNGELLNVKNGKTFYGSPKAISTYLAHYGV